MDDALKDLIMNKSSSVEEGKLICDLIKICEDSNSKLKIELRRKLDEAA